MKIGIITFWNSEDNYGQLLQCYATQEFLRNLGHDSVIIKYAPNYISHAKKCVLSQLKKCFYPKYYIYFSRLIYKKIHDYLINTFILNHNIDRNFTKFRNEVINFTKEYNSETLCTDPPNVDIYLCGSDQIWSNGGNDKIYFLDFVKTDTPKHAWSASFGRDFASFSSQEKNNIKELISTFTSITLREVAGLEICEKLGRKDSLLICDPTLLNDKYIYDKISTDSEIAETNDKIFIYFLGHKSIISDSKIIKLFKSINTPIQYTVAQGRINSFPKVFPTIGEWISCIRNAKFVVTNSFHGTIFSIIFRKQFVTIPLKNSTGANTRISTLLNKLSLSNRICTNIDQLKKCYKEEINYLEIEDKIRSYREESMDIINTHILNSKK